MNQPYFLYVEDDADDVDIMKEMIGRLHQPGELVCVANGYDLLEHLQYVREKQPYPSLIILDLRLPRLNGIETLELLRTDDLYRLIPVVVFTSKLTATEKEHCQSLGAEVLLKPLTYTEWLGILDHFAAYADM
jgi:CheY-like chemotaxis protein